MQSPYPDPVSWDIAFNAWVQNRAELGAEGLETEVKAVRQELQSMLERIQSLPVDPELTAREPDDLQAIRALRPQGQRIINATMSETEYRDRLEGAFLGRCAGCTLGSPVEIFPVDKMEQWASYIGDPFPPIDYWSQVERPNELKYQMSPRAAFTRDQMDGVPTDDDIIFTQLGLLILEDHGPDFTIEDVGQSWIDYLPYAETAEKVALRNLKDGVPADQAAAVDNPFDQWIGADIRSDPWGYVAPGLPEKAAELAYRDAYISHRRNGIYGAMYFSAVIAAAFTVDHPVDALHIGLEEIPAESRFAQAIRWALAVAPSITDYRVAHDAIAEHFNGMHRVHAINNAALTVWGLNIGGRDFTRVIGEIVAMGYDHDCTAATAGSIVGAVVGRSGIPEHWWKNFNNKTLSYLNGHRAFAIDDLLDRFAAQAKLVRGTVTGD